MARQAVHIVAHGRVQGVGFRFFVRMTASRFGVKGWVRNLVDGSVEAHAEGDRDTLEAFVEKVREGPAFGHVTDLDIDWSAPSEQMASFEIR